MNGLLNYKYESKRGIMVLYSLFTIIILINILTLSNIANALLTIPQYIVVLYFLTKNDIKNSILWHFSFILLSLSAQRTLGMFEGKEFMMYNYGTIKLIGPLRACYIMNIIYVLILMGSKYRLHKELLFYKFYKSMLYLGLSAGVIGILGLIFHPYYSINGFIDYGIYVFVLLTSIYILLKVADSDFIKCIFYLCLISMMAGILGSFLAYAVFGVTSSYGAIEDIAYQADIIYMAPVLIIGALSIKQHKLLAISLVLYAIIILSAMEGKAVFSLAFSFLMLAYILYFDKDTKIKLKGKLKIIRPIIVLAVLSGGIYLAGHLASDSMAFYKIESAASMFTGDLDEMGRSPYIRVASLINIINEDLHNPFTLLFGNGYGGYFEDNLDMFVGLDLSKGAWTDDVIKTGRYTSGHDTMVTVPLFNGLIGIIVIIRICWLYIKRIPFNFMNGIAFIWIVLMFYANTMFAYIGVCCLLAGEYDINNTIRLNSCNFSPNEKS